MLTETTEETTDNNGWADENMNQNENGKECKSLCYKYKTEKGYLCNNPKKGTFSKKKWCKIDKEDVLKNNLTLTEPNKNVLGQYWDYIEEEIPGKICYTNKPLMKQNIKCHLIILQLYSVIGVIIIKDLI